jgi:cytochrome c oxidase subunit II
MKPAIAFVSVFVAVGCICAAVFYFVAMDAHSGTGAALRVRAVARQWWWEFDYTSLAVRTTDVLYLPTDSNVQLELVSGDVIHSFWIAGMKDSVDVIPGKTRLLNIFVKSPGELYGNCNSGCGCGTVCMRFRVFAKVPLEFQRWAARARLHRSELKAPSATETPACALVTPQGGHVIGHSPVSRLQQVLDHTLTAGHRLH